MSRVVLHLSDLHFGRIGPGMPERLLKAAWEIGPDVVVVSGDLTQRARTLEFEEAREFLHQLPSPQIVVPGNHDVPLHSLYGRFVQRLARFRTYITPDLAPSYVDEEIAVFGVNTARSLTWKGGRINEAQIEALRQRLCELPAPISRIVATHHPFDVPKGFHRRELLGSARIAFERWAACGADLLLCGHLHIGGSTTTLDRYGAGHHAAIVASAGTATSTRGRGEPNSFNAITVEGRGRVVVARWSWDPSVSAYFKTEETRFTRSSAGWIRSADEGAA